MYLNEAILSSAHNLCFRAEVKEIMSLMEIKGFLQCIAANKQQACGLAAAASCGMVTMPLVSFSYAN